MRQATTQSLEHMDPAAHDRQIAGGIAGSYALAAAAGAAGTVGERLQTEAEGMLDFQRQMTEAGAPGVGQSEGLIGHFVEVMGNAPDMKSLGLGIAMVAAMRMVAVAEKMGTKAEDVEQSRVRRFLNRAGSLAITGVLAYSAYKSASVLTPAETVAAGVGIMGAGAAYMHIIQAATHRSRQAS